MIVGAIHPDSRRVGRRGCEYVFSTVRFTADGTRFVEHHRFSDPVDAARERDKLLTANPNAQERA